LLAEARDITTPLNGIDKRTSLTNLLQRLSTAADIGINALAKLIGISSPNQVAAMSSPISTTSLDYNQYKEKLFRKCKNEIDNVVDTLKIDLQNAKVRIRLAVYKRYS